MKSTPRFFLPGVWFILAGWLLPAFTQAQNGSRVPPHHHHGWIVPITRPMIAPRPEPQVRVTQIDARIRIEDQVAITTLDIALHNPHSRQLESEIVLPVPDGSVLQGFTFDGTGIDVPAKILPKDEARRIYQRIVSQTKDPALLEFIGTGLIQSSVFPVPANGRQRVRVTWEQLLTAEGDRLDYALPRSEGLDYRIPWTFKIEIRSNDAKLATLFSPSHELDTDRKSKREIHARSGSSSEPGPFLLSILRQVADGPTASLVAYPDPKVGGGYFMLLTAPPAAAEKTAIKREVTVVIDRSGSMAGGKLDQVREAALQVLEGLDDGEAFNIIVYNEAVEMFSPQPIPMDRESMQKARSYLKNLRVSGGTNIHDALVEALRQKPVAGDDALPIVLFLTDGLPTIGQTSEKAIREAAEAGNPHNRRIFTFGVGVDVNTPLLNRIARDSRATATYVLPNEDVEVKVASVYRRLVGPVLADPVLEIVDRKGRPEPGRVTDLLPSELPDIFEGEQMVLLGQYRGEEPLHVRLKGRDRNGPRTFKFSFQFDKATTRNAYVSRLWASNKIGVLSEAIRDYGAAQGLIHVGQTNLPLNDPKIRELVDEIVRLSREFGILTEYTAFFAEEGTNLTSADAVRRQTGSNYWIRGVQTRSGVGSVNQEFNSKAQIETKKLNPNNAYWDATMSAVEIANVQQVNDRAFFKRGNQWIDSQLIDNAAAIAKPDEIIEIGSEAFIKLVDQLAAGNRQGCIALKGEILLQVAGRSVLVK